MKIGGAGPAQGLASAGARAGASASPGFAPSLGSAAPAAAAAGPAVAAGVAGLEALLALQELGGPLERRRRAVARAGRLLDGLEAVKLALLDGADADAALLVLARAASEGRESLQETASDEGLSGVLDEIETRAAVEIAKREVGRRAA